MDIEPPFVAILSADLDLALLGAPTSRARSPGDHFWITRMD
jgi:hypothetical protein